MQILFFSGYGFWKYHSYYSFWKKILAKLFLGAIILALILSMAPMGLLFYAFILSSTPFGLWMEKDLNKDYRAQIVSYSVMTPPWLQIIEKKD